MGFFSKLLGKLNEKQPRPSIEVTIEMSKPQRKPRTALKIKGLTEIGEIDICPHCKKKLEQIPTRKKKCKFCGEEICVRKRPFDRKKVLVTKKQKKQIDLQWAELSTVRKWADKLAWFGVTPKQIEKEKEKLSKKFKREASYKDAIWAILNASLAKYISNDLQRTKIIYFDIALLLDGEGKNGYEMLYQSSKTQLLIYKQTGIIKKVKILSTKGCEECTKLDGKIYSIDKALKEMPLPVKNCKHHNDNDKYGWCRCCWTLVINN